MKPIHAIINCLFLLLGLIRLPADVATTTEEDGNQLRLESGYIPVPIRLERGASKQAVRSVRIVGEVPAQGDGTGEIWLDERLGEPNALGDVAKLKGAEPAAIPVELRQVLEGTGRAKDQSGIVAMLGERAKASAGFRLYDVVFPGGQLEGRLKLVLGTPKLGPHRLLVYGKALHGVPTITSVLPDPPLDRRIDLSGDYTTEGGRIRRLQVSGILGGSGTLVLDPNYITFDSFGEPVMSTAMALQRQKISLKSGVGDDPLELGRRHYWAVPEQPRNQDRVAVVLGRTETGPHRLLVYHGDQLAFIVPASLPQRRQQEIAASALNVLSTREQQAIEELRRAVGHGFRTEIKEGHAIGLNFYGEPGSVVPNGVLAQLPHLRSIQFGAGRFPAAGLVDLQELRELRGLFFDQTELGAAGLASLKDLRQLDSLTFFDCRGIDDEGLKHLARLTALRRLSFYSERRLRRPPDEGPCISDAGVTQLKGLVLVERLNLEGHDLSDNCVPVLNAMKDLQELALSGEGFTDAGVAGLASLSKLRSLRLIDTSATTSGVAQLKARLPGLRVETWRHDGPQHD